MKRMFVISNMYPSEKDPVYGTFVQDFVEGMTNLEWQVSKAVISGRSRNRWEKIRKYVRFYLSILYRLTIYRYDLVYVHIVTHAALPLRFVSLFRSLNLVFNVHGEDLLTQTRLSAWFLKLAVPLMQRARLVVLPSAYFERRFRELLPVVPVEKLFVSPSGGVDTELFCDCSAVVPDRYTIGYVSRIDRGKGWDTFLSALKILKEKEYPIQAVLIGRGEEEPRLRKMISVLGLSDVVEYPGAIAHEKLPEYYSRMSLFVFPTQLEESLGLVGLEAMSCGIPVAGSRIGGLTDYIEDEVNGFFFRPGDASDLADKISIHYACDCRRTTEFRTRARLTALRYDQKYVLSLLSERIAAL